MNSKVARVRLKSPRNIQNALSTTQQDLSLISCTATVLIKRILRKQHKYTERIQDNKHSEMHIGFLMPYNNIAHCHWSSSYAVTMNASCNEHVVKCTDKSKQTYLFKRKWLNSPHSARYKPPNSGAYGV